GAARHKVRLVRVMFVNQAEEIPTQAEINRKLLAYFPIVIEVETIIVFPVIGLRNIRNEYPRVARSSLTRRTADVIRKIRSRTQGVQRRNEEHLRNSRVVRTNAGARSVRVNTLEPKFPTRPWRLQRRELHMLILVTHLKRVFSVNLREVIGELNCGTDLIGRQKSITAYS